ncbi:MAG TPA: TonB-dependent receptor, partial [Chryseosolibacter sp.]|nr:TonB-dependent receptor [Chryseosolibacter sp.]
MKKLLLLSGFLAFSASLFAQNGFIRGKITDGETGEGLYGATVMKQGTGIGVVADFDGNYSLSLEPGLHTIVLTFISYKTQTVENVQVSEGKVTALDFVMSSIASELEEVVVTGEALRDTETGIITFQRKSPNVIDGVSNQTFKRTGDRDLATAMGRVTGVSVQSGKFVYVRGLGDRYTRTTLNSMTIPGLDPDRNDVQIDIFPTSVLENVIVYKTFSPNLPGDFTGGIVDVETRNFPEQNTTSVSLGFRFNPDMNLNNNYLTYDGGKTDWLGFDDGTRALPFPSSTVVPDVSSADRGTIETLTRSLNPQLAAQRKRSFLNTSFFFNRGNQINKPGYTIGYTAIFNYQSRFEYFDDAEFGDYTKEDNRAQNGFFAEEIRKGELSRANVLWSGLLSGAIKFDKHNFSATVFRTQNGQTEVSDRISRDFDQTQATLDENILTYSQRSVTNALLTGTHQLGRLRLDWKNSYTVARTYDPDFRETAIDISNVEMPTLNTGAGAGIRRFWRDLNEFNENFKADFALPYGKGHKFQFGVLGLYKDRNFQVFNYRINVTERSGVPVDPDYFLQEENIWTASERRGTYLEGNPERTNNYDARSSVYAGYIMTEMTLGKFKAVYGARVEKADMFYTGEDSRGNIFDDSRTLDELDVLPSVNLVYGLSETMNVRGSFGQTLARPSFKEKSAAQIYDPITKRFFNGNLDLHQTLINNFDVRWEDVFRNGDMISLSGFYKEFDGHIELVTYDVAPDNVKPRNAGASYVYGLEFELRKKLDFITPGLSNFSIGTNITLTNSEVDLKSVIVNESGLTEWESRQNNAREGEVVASTRPMGGQSPYLVNAYLNFSDSQGFFNANLSYNVQGESLFIIGVGAVPDIYTQPFNSLNLNIYRDFGPHKNHRLTLGVNNLLMAEDRDLYKGYGRSEAVYS